jgi:hypothetical protein
VSLPAYSDTIKERKSFDILAAAAKKTTFSIRPSETVLFPVNGQLCFGIEWRRSRTCSMLMNIDGSALRANLSSLNTKYCLRPPSALSSAKFHTDDLRRNSMSISSQLRRKIYRGKRNGRGQSLPADDRKVIERNEGNEDGRHVPFLGGKYQYPIKSSLAINNAPKSS